MKHFCKYIFVLSLGCVLFLNIPFTAVAAGAGGEMIAVDGVGIDPLLRPEGAPAAIGEERQGENEDVRRASQAERYSEVSTRILLITRLVNVLLGVAGVVAIFFIIQNGFWLIVSAGKEETISQHKKGLAWAVIGLILIILSYSIIRFVISIPFQADEAPAATSPSAASQ